LKSSNHSSLVIDRELQELPVQPMRNPILRRPNLPAQGQARRWQFDRTEALLTAGGLVFLCVIFVVLVQFIHPAPDELTIQQDSAELARVEEQTQIGNVGKQMPAPAALSNSDSARPNSKAKGHSQSKARQPGLIARRTGPVDRKTDLASNAENDQSSGLKKYPQRQTDRDLQMQQAMASRRQRYAQQRSDPVLAAIGRALGFSTQ
jgi:hypothetical protein